MVFNGEMRRDLSAEQVRELLDYEPTTGIFRWRVQRGRYRVGTIAGRLNSVGYLQIMINQRNYYAQRIAWLHVHGEWPPAEIDHANCIPADNRIANLRLATRSTNQANTPPSRANTSGFKGVSFFRRDRKWIARITKDGQGYYLGLFATAEEAHAAYCVAAVRLFGEFARAA